MRKFLTFIKLRYVFPNSYYFEKKGEFRFLSPITKRTELFDKPNNENTSKLQSLTKNSYHLSTCIYHISLVYLDNCISTSGPTDLKKSNNKKRRKERKKREKTKRRILRTYEPFIVAIPWKIPTVWVTARFVKVPMHNACYNKPIFRDNFALEFSRRYFYCFPPLTANDGRQRSNCRIHGVGPLPIITRSLFDDWSRESSVAIFHCTRLICPRSRKFGAIDAVMYHVIFHARRVIAMYGVPRENMWLFSRGWIYSSGLTEIYFASSVTLRSYLIPSCQLKPFLNGLAFQRDDLISGCQVEMVNSEGIKPSWLCEVNNNLLRCFFYAILMENS